MFTAILAIGPALLRFWQPCKTEGLHGCASAKRHAILKTRVLAMLTLLALLSCGQKPSGR